MVAINFWYNFEGIRKRKKEKNKKNISRKKGKKGKKQEKKIKKKEEKKKEGGNKKKKIKEKIPPLNLGDKMEILWGGNLRILTQKYI